MENIGINDLNIKGLILSNGSLMIGIHVDNDENNNDENFYNFAIPVILKEVQMNGKMGSYFAPIPSNTEEFLMVNKASVAIAPFELTEDLKKGYFSFINPSSIVVPEEKKIII